MTIISFEGGDEKEYIFENENGMEVWTDKGFTPLRRIMRHHTNKRIYRITTHTGVVKVTEDHSLLDEKARKISPKSVEIGSRLLTSPNPKVGGNINIPNAWVWGFFYRNGSCGGYKNPYSNRYIFDIINANLEYLWKAKNLLETNFNCTFEILNTRKNSGVYKLVLRGNLNEFVKRWQSMFYDDNYQCKKIPDEIFDADKESRQKFFEGYYAGNSNKDFHGYTTDNKGQIGSMGLYLLATSLGFQVSINTRSDKLDIYRLTMTKDPILVDRKSNEYSLDPAKLDLGVIKKIEDLGLIDDYVYDLETENHHFAAGVGQLIVHNTDSCMIIFDGATLEESFDLCKKVSIIVTHYLKCWILGVNEDIVVTTRGGKHYTLDKINSKHKDFKNLTLDDKIKVLEYESVPIDLEFENMYGRLLLLSKKRYKAYIVNREGNIIGKVDKGTVIVRRNNSEYLRITYKKMADGILNDENEDKVMRILYNRVNKLFTRQIPDTQLIIYTGINKNVMNYAKNKEFKKGRTAFKMYYLDENNEAIDDPIGPLDPRLVYPNYPQTLLALKMINRGTDIPPNTRLEYLYIENPEAEHQGDKAEDYTYYHENREIENLHPDYLHYIEKQLTNPISELLAVKYPREPVIYEKLDDALMRVLSSREISELKQNRLARTRRFIKPRPEGYTPQNNVLIGWDAVSAEDNGFGPEKWMTFTERQRGIYRLSKDSGKFTEYEFTGKEARVMYVLESAKKSGINEFNPKQVIEAKIINICKRWKARVILNAIYKKHGLKKCPMKRPTQTGDRLRTNTQIMLLYSLKGQSKDSIGKVIDVYEEESGQKKKYYYDLLMDEASETIINHIPREAIATFYLRDSAVMKDILKARTHYKEVVVDLKNMFNPLRFMTNY